MDARPPARRVSADDLEGWMRQIVAAVLERLCVPFLVMDASGRAAFTNDLSDAILADGRHARLSDDGQVILVAPQAAIRMRDFLVTLGQGPANVDVLLPAPPGGLPLFASLALFQPPAMRGFAALPPLAVVFFREGYDADGIALARDHYGLSEAEMAVLTTLFGGQTIAEHAAARGISINTARKQLNTLMRKMGVNRQSQITPAIDALTGRGTVAANAADMIARNESARLN